MSDLIRNSVTKDRLRRLDKIHQALRCRERSLFSPKQLRVALAGIFAFFGGTLIQDALRAMHIPTESYPNTVVCCLLAAMAAWYVNRTSKAASSWTMVIDRELAAYDPVNVDAYTKLQMQTVEAGGITRDSLSEWLTTECDAVTGEGEIAVRDRFAFLRRQPPVR